MPHKLFKGFPDERTLTRRTSSVSCSSGLCLVCGPHRLYPRPLQERLHTVLMAALTVELFLLLSKQIPIPQIHRNFPNISPLRLQQEPKTWTGTRQLSFLWSWKAPISRLTFSLGTLSKDRQTACRSASQPATPWKVVAPDSTLPRGNRSPPRSFVGWFVRRSFIDIRRRCCCRAVVEITSRAVCLVGLCPVTRSDRFVGSASLGVFSASRFLWINTGNTQRNKDVQLWCVCLVNNLEDSFPGVHWGSTQNASPN